MVRLPDPTDYGARPSLQSNRRDRPSTGGVALAESLTQAANVFAQEVEKRQKKQDALNYALARNDILIADIEARNSLEDNPNWREYDNLYTEAFKTNSEAARRKYKLDPADGALLDAEINLIRARGRVDVGGQAKKMEIGEGVANLNAGLAAATENIINQRPGHRNHLILGQLEAIEAAREKGYLTAPEAEAMRQGFTQEIATKVLETVDSSEKVAMLEATLKYRRGGDPKDKDFTASDTGQGPISIEDIRAGKGTGSVADFLHTDTAAKMLRSAYKEDKDNLERIASQEARQKAESIYPQDYLAQRKWIEKNYEGAVEKMALTDMEIEQGVRDRERAKAGRELYENYALTIERLANDPDLGGPMTLDQLRNDMPASEKELMGPSLFKSLEDEIKNRSKGIQYAEFTQSKRIPNGRSLEEWNDMPNFGEGSKVEANLESPEWRQALSEADWWAAKDTQASLEALLSANVPVANYSPMVTDMMQSKGWGGVTGGDARNAMQARMMLKLNQDVAKLQQSKVPPSKATDGEVRELLAGYFIEAAKTEVGMPDPTMAVWQMNEKQYKKAYSPLPALQDLALVEDDLTYLELFRQIAKEYGETPSEMQMQQAHFRYVQGEGTGEIMDALVGDKYWAQPWLADSRMRQLLGSRQ